MIITNSTPDKYYYNQLIAFLMSIKMNSPKHMRLMRVFLANYPKDLEMKLKKAFHDVEFENNPLKMIDKRGFGVIVDRAIRVIECFDKYKESVVWLDTDILVRGDISELLEIKPKQLKILYRKGSPERVRINAGVFNIGYSKETYDFICEWYNRIKVNKRWGQGQLEFWRAYKRHRDKVKMIELSLKYNSTGKFNDEYIIWHCKKGHFDRVKYQEEYKDYLAKAEKHMGI
jgi:hypothetical protein